MDKEGKEIAAKRASDCLKIIEELIKILSEGNCSFATLEVRESNETARRLYEKYGFKLQGIRRDFYSAPRENACIYTLYFNNEVIQN